MGQQDLLHVIDFMKGPVAVRAGFKVKGFMGVTVNYRPFYGILMSPPGTIKYSRSTISTEEV